MDTTPTRGEFNNNPCNIDYHPQNAWQGQLGIELVQPGHSYTPRFARFSAPEYGIRAAGKLLLHYQLVDGFHTIPEMISKWAPGNENNTQAYIANVEKWTGLTDTSQLDPEDDELLARVLHAIITEENGRCLYDLLLIRRAAKMALGMA